MQGWAGASDNEALISQTGQNSHSCLVTDGWDWVRNDGEPAEGESEDAMVMDGGGWLDLVNGQAAGKLLLFMQYDNSLIGFPRQHLPYGDHLLPIAVQSSAEMSKNPSAR
jgi:hypothetical protein